MLIDGRDRTRVKRGGWGCISILLLLIAASCAQTCFADSLDTSHGKLRLQRIIGGLNHPWGMAFLPDERLLVTERSGTLRILGQDGSISPPLSGTPTVFAEGQGGMLDVAIDKDFAKEGWVYLSFAEPGAAGASTAVGRGRLNEHSLLEFRVIFRQLPKVSGGNHFGGRILFGPDGMLYLTLGERYKFQPAQDLTGHLGALVRITPTGDAPGDNPFIGQAAARPEIWSYGHRNVQAAAFNPENKELWIGEMGPRGGDELNLIMKGGNYGWPVVSWGTHYNLQDIPDPPTRPDFVPPVKQWTPVISPSGMTFYSGAMFSKWRGDLFIGGLTTGELVRVKISGKRAVEEERIRIGSRVRDVAEAPDGSLYLLTDSRDGEVLRLSLDQMAK